MDEKAWLCGVWAVRKKKYPRVPLVRACADDDVVEVF
jgi:hypothetical protein